MEEDKTANVEEIILELKKLYIQLSQENTEQENKLNTELMDLDNIKNLKMNAYEEFLIKYKEGQEKEKVERIKKNENNKFLKLPKAILIRYVFEFFDIDQLIKFTEICVSFNTVIKSIITFKFMINAYTNTKIDIGIGPLLPSSNSKQLENSEEKILEKESFLKGFNNYLKEKNDFFVKRKIDFSNDVDILNKLVDLEKSSEKKLNEKMEGLSNKLIDEKVKYMKQDYENQNKYNGLLDNNKNLERQICDLNKYKNDLNVQKHSLKNEFLALQEKAEILINDNTKKDNALHLFYVKFQESQNKIKEKLTHNQNNQSLNPNNSSEIQE